MAKNGRKNNSVSIWKKYLLSVKEAASYFGIGGHKLIQIINDNKTGDYFLWNGAHFKIKRRLFEKYLNSIQTIE